MMGSKYSNFSNIKALINIWPYIWVKDSPWIRSKIVISFISLIFAKASVLLLPIMLKEIIDSLTLFSINTSSSKEYLYNSVLIYIFIYSIMRISNTIFSEIKDGIFITITQKILKNLTLKVFQHIHSLDLNYHIDRQTGSIINVINRGTKAVESLLIFTSFNVIPTIIEIILVCLLLFSLYGNIISIIMSLIVIIYVYFTLKITTWRLNFIYSMNQNDRKSHAKIADSLLNYETVKYFCNENYEKDQLNLILNDYERSSIHNRLSLSLLNIGQSIIVSIGFIAVMIISLKEILNKNLTIGDFVAINSLLIQVYMPLSNFGFAYREVKLSLINLLEMFSLLKMNPKERNNQLSSNQPHFLFEKGKIIFNDVSFFYDSGELVLKNISFAINTNETVAIIGPSGSGKSTIAKILLGFYKPISGTVTIDGRNIQGISCNSLRNFIGIVPQEIILFNDTVYYNIAYGNPSLDSNTVKKVAKLVNIHDFIVNLPEGYETLVGERGLKLSGGERQRIAIARVILKNPEVFLFDEATSALDLSTELDIRMKLKDISKNKTTIIITHKISNIIHADKIIILNNGMIEEIGKHSELISKSKFYQEIWNQRNF